MNKTYTFDENTVSDLHKDAFGFRPSEAFWMQWKTSTDTEKQGTWDYLVKVMQEEMEYDRRREAAAIERLDQRIASLMHHGARNREMAIRWIAEAYECTDDLEHLEWNLGVPFGHITSMLGLGGFRPGHTTSIQESA